MYATAACPTTSIVPIVGVGLNSYFYNASYVPNYMLDILCDPTASIPTNLDVNVGCPNCGPADAVGYRIGDSMVIWHGGILNANNIISSLFAGVGAGGINPVQPVWGPDNTFVGSLAGYYNTPSTVSFGFDDTYLGYAAGYGFGSGATGNVGDSNVYIGVNSGYSNTTGSVNVFSGSQSGYSNTSGDSDIYIGNHAGYNNTIGVDNTYIGNYAGFSGVSSNAEANTYLGDHAGYSTTTGSFNTITGHFCGRSVTTGYGNSFYGKHAGASNTTGYHNNFYGWHDGFNTINGVENCSFGQYGFWSNVVGDSNVVMGNYADYYGGASGGAPTVQNLNVFIGDWAVRSFNTGDSNVFLGAMTDISSVLSGTINDAGAIGYGAVSTASDKIILGNNKQDIGIGMSHLDPGTGPTNRLEISYFSQTNPEPCTTAPTSTFTSTICSGTNPTGASGLQFRDLNFSSIPYTNNSSSGFLTVDDKGNVVYMAQKAGVGIGTCCNPSTFPANPMSGCTNDPAISLQTSSPTILHDFWFEGNCSGQSDETNVYIGYDCSNGNYPLGCSITAPTNSQLAKLSVLQHSTAENTICGYFENDDPGLCTNPPNGAVIGVKSLLPSIYSSTQATKIAGWFEADNAPNCCSSSSTAPQYAIYVPKNGGHIAVGYVFTSSAGTNNQICPNASYILDINGSGWSTTNTWTGSDSTLKKNVTPIPNALASVEKLQGVSFNYVDSAIHDSAATGTHYGFIAQKLARVISGGIVNKNSSNGLMGIAYSEVIPWLVEGMKQQQTTIDSLKTVLNSIQTCLASLCDAGGGGGHGANRHNNGGSNSDDSNVVMTNQEDVTLSAFTNAPLLYQNIPNPFTSGTKINYFLPANIQGASIVFYDTYGNQLKVVQLSQTGNGTLNITPDNLSAGIYSYSLVVNNNVIDTKRMILQK